MCLKGGPRCHTHAKVDANNALQKQNEQGIKNNWLGQEENLANERRDEYSGNDVGIIRRLEKDKKKAHDATEKGKAKYVALSEKANAALKSENATAGGIEELKVRIENAERKRRSIEALQQELEEAQATYASNLQKYDERNGTVDARKPSPYGDFEGIETLNSRLNKNEQNLENLYKQSIADGITPELTSKIDKAELASVNLRKQLDHAMKTAQHRRQGIIPAAEKKKPEPGSQKARISNALESNLNYTGRNPGWIRQMQKESKDIWGPNEQPRIIDVVDSPAGKLAVVWSPRSMNDNDDSIQKERGFIVSETALVSMKTGEKLGYLKASYVDDASAAKSFGNDQWSSLAYMDEYSGSSFGIKVYKDIEPVTVTNKFGKTRTKNSEKVNAIQDAKTPEALLQAKRNIWAKSHSALKINPSSLESAGTYVAYYNLNSSHAPTTEAEINADMKPVKAIADKEYADFKKDYSTPYVDFARAENKIKGTGLGSSLYVYSARMLGKQGKVLRGSGMQSDDATGVWKRFIDNDKLPVKKITRNHSKAGKQENLALDFRDSK